MPQNTESKQNKGADSGNKTSVPPDAAITASKFNVPTWIKSRWLIVGAALVLLVAGGVLAYWFINKNQTTNNNEAPAAEEEQSLAQKLENVEYGFTPTKEDIANHDLSVGFAYMEENNYDKALELYLKVEEAGLSSSRMFKDMATIYKSWGDEDKYNEYTQKYLDYLEQEASDQKDKLSEAGTYIALGHEYEDNGDIESAKQSYQKAKDILDSYKAPDKYLAAQAKESKIFLEDKLKSL